MRSLEVRLRRGPGDELVVGALARRDGRTYFEYSPALLATGLELSPWKLPARPGLQEHPDPKYGELPGLFADSLPDGWGLLLMDRHVRQQGRDPGTLDALDRLALLGARTMGALTYHPPATWDGASGGPLDLAALAAAARRVLSGSRAKVLPELLRSGGSPAGARPKVLVGLRGDEVCAGEDDLPDGFEPWLVKFGAKADGHDAGRVELAYSRLQVAAGIDVPPARLFEAATTARRGRASAKEAWFGVRRFDRLPGNRRLHVSTLGALLHADHRVPSCDYDHLLKVARRLTKDHRVVVQCFRRMAFNVAAHDRDDHVKNFAFVLGDDGAWALSPAYDVTYSHGPGGEHQMSVNGEGAAPARDHVLALGVRHGVSKTEAEAVLDEVNAALKRWRREAKAAGCRAATITDVGAAHRRL